MSDDRQIEITLDLGKLLLAAAGMASPYTCCCATVGGIDPMMHLLLAFLIAGWPGVLICMMCGSNECRQSRH